MSINIATVSVVTASVITEAPAIVTATSPRTKVETTEEKQLASTSIKRTTQNLSLDNLLCFSVQAV